MHQHQPPDGNPVSHRRLHDLISFEYRAAALLRLGVTAEWRDLDWVDSAACIRSNTATEATCTLCPVIAECLAAAVATDDAAPWRGGLNRIDRKRLWSGLDRTYRDLRDFDSMRLDPTNSRARANLCASGVQPVESNGARP